MAVDRQAAAGTGDAQQQPRGTAPDPKVPKNIWSPTLTLFDVDDEEIARQLSLVDFGIFAKITV